MRILITGGSGTIGKAFIREFPENEYFNVRYQYKPFMIWIWLSVALMSFGGILSFIKKNG